jgi:hypothetical protein
MQENAMMIMIVALVRTVSLAIFQTLRPSSEC